METFREYKVNRIVEWTNHPTSTIISIFPKAFWHAFDLTSFYFSPQNTQFSFYLKIKQQQQEVTMPYNLSRKAHIGLKEKNHYLITVK